MSTTPAAAPGPVGGFRNVRLSELLRQPVTDTGGESIGRLSDVIVRLRGADFPVVTGLVVGVEKRSLFVPIDQVGVLGGQQLRLSSARLDLRQFERREGEVLLRADVLGHRLLDVDNARLIRAADLVDRHEQRPLLDPDYQPGHHREIGSPEPHDHVGQPAD